MTSEPAFSPIKLIVGLANPGQQYQHTRHNAGAWFIDAICQQTKLTLRLHAKFHGLYAREELHGQVCHLLIPTTYMNLSGQAVSACMNFYKILPQEILIAHDDIDLPVGSIKLKYDGGDGGHNGLKDIIRHLSTKQFHRLRIGVGRPTHGDTVDYVLSPPSKADQQKIIQSLQEVELQLPTIVQGDFQKAMQALHAKK